MNLIRLVPELSGTRSLRFPFPAFRCSAKKAVDANPVSASLANQLTVQFAVLCVESEGERSSKR
jgi:hypothetical protein